MTKKKTMSRQAFEKRLVELGYLLSEEDCACAYDAYLKLQAEF